MSEHKWFLCTMCGPAVICGTCGNNTCNAGQGTLPNGEPCPDCEAAYQVCHSFYESDLGKIFGKYLVQKQDEYLKNWKYAEAMEYYLHEKHPELLKEMHKELHDVRNPISFDSFPHPDRKWPNTLKDWIIPSSDEPFTLG